MEAVNKIDKNTKEATTVGGSGSLKSKLKILLSNSRSSAQRKHVVYLKQQVEGLNSYAIVAITNESGMIKYANENFSAVSGFSVEALIGVSFNIINSGFHGSDFFENIWMTVKRGDIWKGEIKSRNRDGTYFWLDAIVIPTKDQSGKANEYLWICQNVTSKKETELLYRDLIQATPLGFWLADREGRILVANQAYSDLSGYSIDELQKMSIADLEANEDREDVKAHIRTVIQRGSDFFETKHRRHDGTIIDVEIHVTYQKTRGGLFTIFIHDISDRKKIYEFMKLEKESAKRLADSRTRFISTMSHEIRTPLSGIIGMARLLLNSESSLTTAKSLERILSTALSLNQILNEILDFSKIEAGKVQIEKIDFNFLEMFDSLKALFDSVAKMKGLYIYFVIDPKIPECLIGDSFRLRQILTNLIGNAIKFTSSGSISIEVKIKEETNERVKLAFYVRDTGIGIEPHVLANLTSPFFQADSSVSRKFGGTGLGLFITKNILNLMSSDLKIESDFGSGSVFSFEIDFEVSRFQSLASSLEKNLNLDLCEIFKDVVKRISKRPIMVAEDDLVNQLVIAGFFKIAGIQFKIVANGAECLQEIETNPDGYACILMDIHMPTMNGLEATSQVRKINQKIPIIALTAGVSEEDLHSCILNGMNDVLMKPIDPVELAKTLESNLNDLEKIGPAQYLN